MNITGWFGIPDIYNSDTGEWRRKSITGVGGALQSNHSTANQTGKIYGKYEADIDLRYSYVDLDASKSWAGEIIIKKGDYIC